MLSHDDKREIAGRARTLRERLEGPPNEAGREPAFDSDELLSVWTEKLGGEEQFRRRFSNGDVSVERCLEAAATTRWPEDEPLPEWIDALEELIATVRETSGEARQRAVDEYPEHPFTHLFSVIVEDEKKRVLAEIDESVVHPDAIDSMAEWLHRRLVLRFTRILYVEFKAFVASHDEKLATTGPNEIDDPPTEYYERFVAGLLDGDLANLCVEYPVFARLLTRQLHRWRDTIREIAERVRTDRDVLSRTFGREEPLGAVTDLQPLADDTHQDGRAVVRVSFAEGTRVVYKPRSVRSGEVFYSILERLDDDLPTPDFERPTFVPRDSYGWMEWVEYRECSDEEAVERYYERAGALIAMAYSFEFTDCHFENLVVHGPQPILVDGETLMHPYVGSKHGELSEGVASFLSDSVLLTSMVPWSVDAPDDDTRPDMSVMSGIGNGSDPIRISAYRGPQVEAVNTDVMSVSMEHPVIDRDENTPHVDGTEQLPEEYTDAIVRGFSETYETLQSLHEEGRLLGDVVSRDRISGVENRLVYRATRRYMRIVESLCSRACLRDGARYSIEIEQLAGAFFEEDGYSEDEYPVYEAERVALERLDPPRLTCTLDGDVPSFEGNALDVAADESGFERARKRLDSLSESDRRRQAHVLRTCFGRRGGSRREITSRKESTSERAAEASLPTDRTLRKWSVDVFDRVVDAASDPDDGPYSWVWIEPGQDETAGQLQIPGTSLGTGRPGIAIAGAALYQETGAERFRTVARRTVAPLVEPVSAGDVPIEQRGVAGVGGLLYGFAVLAELLEDRKIATCANRIADAIGTGTPPGDGPLRVADGTAGTLLALVAGYERTGNEEMREAAVARGDRLLERRTRAATDHRVWSREERSEPPVGFADGTSGIAYALSRLAAISDESRFAEAASEAMAHVTAVTDRLSDQRRGNAHDRTSERQPSGWFPGRTSYELPRLATPSREPTAPVDADAFVGTCAPGSFDALRGGTFGRVELLTEAARAGISDPTEARRLVATRLNGTVESERFALVGHAPSLVNPTLFDGLAGVSYALLRVTRPDSLPCVLRLE